MKYLTMLLLAILGGAVGLAVGTITYKLGLGTDSIVWTTTVVGALVACWLGYEESYF
jgi:hypothetical protein